MNEYRIAFTHLARKDIIDIGDYITFTLSEPTTSGKFIKGLKHSISQLIIFPYNYPQNQLSQKRLEKYSYQICRLIKKDPIVSIPI